MRWGAVEGYEEDVRNGREGSGPGGPRWAWGDDEGKVGL